MEGRLGKTKQNKQKISVAQEDLKHQDKDTQNSLRETSRSNEN